MDAPAIMAPSVVDLVRECTDRLGYSNQEMQSGAGHDAQEMSRICDTGMIFVPSIGGLSHHPDEWTASESLAKGANVLLHSILRLMST